VTKNGTKALAPAFAAQAEAKRLLSVYEDTLPYSERLAADEVIGARYKAQAGFEREMLSAPETGADATRM
jgi:hypothetical protein